MNKSLRVTKDGGQIAGWYVEETPPTPPPAPAAKMEIEIDGKKEVFTSEDVVNLKRQQASATQKTQKVASILKACEQYGVEPDVFLAQAEGSLALVQKLMEEGHLDETGNIVARALPPQGGNQPYVPPGQGEPPNPPEDMLKKALEKALGPLPDRLKKLEDDNRRLIQMRLEDELLKANPELGRTDIKEVFARHRADPERGLFDHAKAIVGEKKETTGKIEQELIKKYGINVEEFNRNKLLEQEAEGGAAALFKGKKMSFKKGDNMVTPKSAMREFMSRSLHRGG